LDVEPGVELLDPGVFELQGLDLGADHGPLDAGRGLQHHLGARVQAGEIGEILIQPLAQRLRLPDVDHPAALVADPVDPRGFGNLARRRPEGKGSVRISHEATLRSPGSNGAAPRPATMAFVGTFFAAVGRLSVRYRWAIVTAWVAGTVAAMALLPSLSSVTQSDNTSFLPASAPRQRAAQLASPLQGASLTAVTVVAATSGGALTSDDQLAIARLSGALSHVGRVVLVRDVGQSADARAEQLTALAALAQSGGLATAQQASLVAGLRDAIRGAALPAGLTAHTAGTVATRVDTNATSTKTGGQVQWFSIIFVIALLVAVFRSALAPLIAVLPALIVVLVAERLTAEAAVHGLGVSQIASLLLIVLVLGAGTDYALFL